MVKGITNLGCLRDLNEDSFFIKEDDKKAVVAVCDGMGGHNAGDIASKLAIKTIEEFIENNDVYKSVEKKIRLMVLEANKKIFTEACRDKKKTGMGTTMVVAVVNGYDIVVGNIGDSRAYVVGGNSITQITEDHSYVNELLKSGMITKEEARIHPKRNEILKAVGTQGDVFPDIYKLKLKEDEALLLCTDGLSSMLTDEEIFSIINEETGIDEKLHKLVYAANENGGLDNITAILLKNEKGEPNK